MSSDQQQPGVIATPAGQASAASAPPVEHPEVDVASGPIAGIEAAAATKVSESQPAEKVEPALSEEAPAAPPSAEAALAVPQAAIVAQRSVEFESGAAVNPSAEGKEIVLPEQESADKDEGTEEPIPPV